MRTKTGLADVLFSRGRREVLSLMFANADRSYHLRQVVRNTGLSPGTIHRELAQLAAGGVVTRTQRGRQVFFQANAECPVFSELKSLVIKTAGVADVLNNAIRPLSDSINVAFIYGSFARGAERTTSDVDVMVIGTAPAKDVARALSPAERQLGREVNATVYLLDEFRKRLHDGRQFQRVVVAGPKVFLIGGERELAELA